jgi:phosphatidate cytidylyltransferase
LARALAEAQVPRRWGDLGKRAASAAVLAPAALAAIWVDGAVFAALAAALTFGLAAEWTCLCLGRERPPGLLPLGLAWIALSGAAMIWLRADQAAGRANVVFLASVIWASDIGAYAVGRLAGGPRLAPRISPGKTWSGAVGGALAAGAVGVVAARLVGPAAGWLGAAPVGLGLSVVGQSGDLLESLAKRRLGVKHSGRMIPGHGGLLDRLDAMLAAVPAAALLALATGRGVALWQ